MKKYHIGISVSWYIFLQVFISCICKYWQVLLSYHLYLIIDLALILYKYLQVLAGPFIIPPIPDNWPGNNLYKYLQVLAGPFIIPSTSDNWPGINSVQVFPRTSRFFGCPSTTHIRPGTNYLAWSSLRIGKPQADYTSMVWNHNMTIDWCC